MAQVLVYRYGLLPPTSGGDMVRDQMRLAHRYQNTLIEIERARRVAVRAALGAHADTEPLRLRVETLAQALDEHRASIARTRGETRRRSVSPEMRARTIALRDELRAARQALAAATRAIREDPAIRAAVAAIDADAKARAKAARSTCGVYWGTYLLIEAAMDAARKSPKDPRFRRWTGDGAIGVQLQGGAAVTEIIDGSDTRLQIDTTPQPIPGRAGKPRPRVRLRVGSDGREPVWAEWPLILHRPLPPEARVKQAKVVARKVAHQIAWSLHLTLELPDETVLEPCGEGMVAVDLGWRREAETLRAGGWSDGERGEDLLLDPRVVGQLRKAEDLRSIRDRALNTLRSALLDWREAQDPLPPEHGEQLRWLPQWRSPARFAALAHWWREHRITGDEDIVERLEAWRTQDKHLWLWETHARRGAIARRRDQYRVWAAMLARRYQTLVIERLDLRAMAQIPVPESERESHPRARAQRFAAAPSELRTAMVNAFRRRGGRVVSAGRRPGLGAAGGGARAVRCDGDAGDRSRQSIPADTGTAGGCRGVIGAAGVRRSWDVRYPLGARAVERPPVIEPA